MKYETFDELGDKKSRNKIIAYLQEEAHTYDEIAEKVSMNRTSVFYHIKQMKKESRIIERFIGKTAHIGLVFKERDNQFKCDKKGCVDERPHEHLAG